MADGESSSSSRSVTYHKTDLVELLREAQRHATQKGGKQSIGDGIASIAEMKEQYRRMIKIQAPMVRCSRPPFRKLCRLYGTDICYTHMIIADSFVKSPLSRHSEFQLYKDESRLVTQLGVKDANVAARVVADYLFPYCDAFDVNCGCPQSWARKEGIGAALLESPETVRDIVYRVNNSVPGSRVDITVKMRVLEAVSDPSTSGGSGPADSAGVRRTVEFARQMEAAGAAWITIHGRSPWCTANAPVNFELIKLVKESVGVPVVANGGVTCWQSAVEVATLCSVGSVMSGRGLLHNPAAFYAPTLGGHGERGGESDDEPFHLCYSASDADDEPGSGCRSTGGGTHPTGAEQRVRTRRRFHFFPMSHQTRIWRQQLLTCGAPQHSDPPHDGAAESSPSFPRRLWRLPRCPVEVISDFVRLSAACDLPCKATNHHLLMMANDYLSPSERVFLSQFQSSLPLATTIMDLGLFTPRGRYPATAFQWK